jgi:hypothetical protein
MYNAAIMMIVAIVLVIVFEDDPTAILIIVALTVLFQCVVILVVLFFPKLYLSFLSNKALIKLLQKEKEILQSEVRSSFSLLTLFSFSNACSPSDLVQREGIDRVEVTYCWHSRHYRCRDRNRNRNRSWGYEQHVKLF